MLTPHSRRLGHCPKQCHLESTDTAHSHYSRCLLTLLSSACSTVTPFDSAALQQFPRDSLSNWVKHRHVTTALTVCLLDSSQMESTEETESGNHTLLTEFVLSGLSSCPELQHLLFFTFCLVYTMTVVGNLLICVVTVHPTLCTSMYFFLRVLAFLDVSTASTVVPKMLVSFLSEDRNILYTSCATQLYCVIFFGATEWYLLAAMAYDRYVAICNPLRYTVIMNGRVCLSLVLLSCCSGNVVSVVQTAWVFTMPFCGPRKINHFFCDIPPLILLSCTDTSLYEKQMVAATVLVIFTPFCLILVSYACIISSILKISSAESRHKTFSTCSSHLIVVTLYCASGTLNYLRPNSRNSQDTKKVVAVIYTTIIPMLNPLIYSLRNKEVREVLIVTMTVLVKK
ncbi:PREDICTED: olfactory receptor 10A7-like [Lepidothrix coronata]|uniref:Olfactory receptor n=1 Tax=Lepidothrix coronata TaxID=321398 RepID=A0A6J0J710_9PASS|nr:PREDICTED: olfactory receptor 10A7-like [Lepidothrix coronata]